MSSPRKRGPITPRHNCSHDTGQTSRLTAACGYRSRSRFACPGRQISMSPDITYLLMLGLRMAVAAAFVVTASFIAERSGPVIGALVATLPISAGPAYAFLALDHDAAFIAQGALTSLPFNAAPIPPGRALFLLGQRNGLAVGFLCPA